MRESNNDRKTDFARGEKLMGCQIIVGNLCQGDGTECAVFYDSVTDTAFGMIMENLEEAESFQEWLEDDPRTYDVKNLIGLYSEFKEEREEE